jgi:tRNA-2-methylthio-N6-dimethylallyladenosine synthase
VKRLEDLGVKEITLLGQNVNSYNYTHQGMLYQFPDILERVVNEVPSVKWIRFESPHPKDFSPALIELLREEKRLPRHLHVPLQSGSTKILTSMRRKYSRESFLSLISDITTAVPEMTYTTDVMVGFPGESEEDFQETLSLMNEVKFIEAFMYYFNPREGTKAVEMENQVPIEIRLERLNRLIENQRALTKSHKESRCFDSVELMVEGKAKKNKNHYLGRSEHSEMIVFEPLQPLNNGDIVNVQLQGLVGNTYKGTQI